MGDVRFDRPYERLARSEKPAREIRALPDDDVVMALAAASREHDPYLANVLATEAMNRLRRATATVANLGEGVLVVDADGRVTYVNPAGARMLGWDADDLAGKDAHEALHVHEDGTPFPREDCALLECLRAGRTTHRRDHGDAFERKDGTRFPVAFVAAPVRFEGEVTGAVCVFRDLTPEREAEAAARRLAAVVTHADDAITAETPDGVVTHWNPACERLFGYTAEEMVGRSIGLLVSDDRKDELAVTREVGRGGAPRQFETERVRKDGSRVTVSVSLSPVRSESGRPLGLSAVYRDVTERRRAEARVRESEARFRQFFDANPVPTFVVEPDTLRFLAVNEAAVTNYGYARDEFARMRLTDIRPEEDVQALLDFVRERPEGVPVRLWRHRLRDGTVIDVEVTSRKVTLDGKDAWLSVARDVTAERRAEAEVARARARERDALETMRYRFSTLLPAIAFGAGATILFRTLLILGFAAWPQAWNEGVLLVTTTLALVVGFAVGAIVYGWKHRAFRRASDAS